MIKAKLAVFVTPQLAGTLDARTLWNAVVERGKLPPILDEVPYTKEQVLWGETANGVFFVTDLTKTENGFACKITLYPKKARTVASIKKWLARNFFLDEDVRWVVEPPRTLRVYPEGAHISFALENCEQTAL